MTDAMPAEAWKVGHAMTYQELKHLKSDEAFDAGMPHILLAFGTLLVLCREISTLNVLPAAELHFIDGGPLTVLYLLCVDAINFCFWPQCGLEYEHLARGLKVLNADRMQEQYLWPTTVLLGP